jgi:ABC-type transporter Mla subunit MlaD
MPIRHIFLAALLLLLSACGGGALDLNLQLPSAGGLQPGSPVMLNDQVVGQVTAVEPGPSGGFVAKLAIEPKAREQATKGARFVVVRDPADPNRRRVELRPGQPGSPPLAEGATVPGSIESEPLFQLGEMLRSFTEGLNSLRDQVERFRSELQRLPRSEEAKQLKEEWLRLQEEMKQAQEATEETVKKELIPKLQQEMDALEKKFRELEEAAKPEPQSI